MMAWSRWAWLLRRLALLLLVYTALRLLFLVYNRSRFPEAHVGDILWAFVCGLRFDASAIALTNLPFILLSLVPLPRRFGIAHERFLKGLFLVSNLPFLWLNVADVEFFQFNGRRATLHLLGLANDAAVKWSSLFLYYWPLVLLGIGLAVLLWCFFGPDPAQGTGPEPGRLKSGLILVRDFGVAIPLCIIAIRGGLQMKPVSSAQAMPYAPGDLPQLALNSTFTVVRSTRQIPISRVHYFPDQQEVLHYLKSLNEGEKVIPDRPCRDNVVILILESFSAEYWGAGNGGSRYTPFLDSLAEQGLFFRHHYANGRHSMEAVPAILAGLPSLMLVSLAETEYQNNRLAGLGTFLAPYGYTSSFFQGASKGTMFFDTVTAKAGIQRYYSRKDYPDPADHDGCWGIYDEPYLQYVAKELTRQKPPFAATVFTLSSHHPYLIPPQHRGRFKKGTLAIHESIGYTDYAVGQFFATARQQPWYSNTLFIITGDHTQKLETPEYLNTLGLYRVPLLLFHPQKTFAGVDTNRVTEHVDILPSILDYLQIVPSRTLLFGQSVFRKGEGRAFLNVIGHYWLVRGHRALEFIPKGGSRFYDLESDPQLKSPQPSGPEGLVKEAKALIQYFNNGIVDNDLY